MSLIRYSPSGPAIALRGVVGSLLPDGRARLRGAVRSVDARWLADPVYWATMGDTWSRHDSWPCAAEWLAGHLEAAGELHAAGAVLLAPSHESGLEVHCSVGRARIVPGGEERPL